MRFRLNPKAVRVRGSYDDVYAAYGPPRSGKSNWLATVGLEAPGACLFTSTRADLAVHTAAVRARGDRPAYFINPGLDGGFPCNLYYSPVTGCENPLLAMESAGALIHAAPRDPGGSAAWIDGKSKSCLQLLLHAAALSGRDIFTVRQWAADIASPEIPLKILDARGTPGWADELASLAGEAADDPQTASGILGGITGALGWLADPVLAELARPEPGEEFDVRQFIRDQGSVYLIGADTPNNPLSPYFACFVSHFWAEAKRMAADPLEEASRDLKLDPRLLMIIDEPAITCPVPLDRWAAESAGHGIVLVTGFQSDAQLRQRFGDHGGQVLEDLCTVKMVFGGVTGQIARKAAEWGGRYDTWDHVKASDGTKTRQPAERHVFPPERICNLPLGKAFVKHRNTRGFITEMPLVQDHRLYEKADPADFTGVPQLVFQDDAIAWVLLYLALLRSARTPLPAARLAIDPPPLALTAGEVTSWPAVSG